jgi:hypothetical protein
MPAGYWHTAAFPAGYWTVGYWQAYGTGVPETVSSVFLPTFRRRRR